MRYLASLLLLLAFSSLIAQHEVTIKIKNYDNDTLIVGNYYANRQVVVDTLYKIDKKKGLFTLQGEETLAPGMYLLVTRPSGNFVQFFVPSDNQVFQIQLDNDDLGKPRFKGSDENKRFYDYLAFINKKREEVGAINEKIASADEEGETNEKAQAQLTNINEEVEQKQVETISENPDGLLAKLLRSNIMADIPEFEGTEEEKQMQMYVWHRNHYFDNVDLGDSVNLRMPYLHERVDYYYNKLTPLHPDSISRSIDYMLSLMEPSPPTFRYYLSYFYNDIVKKRLVGMDAVVVHLVDQYYANGKAPWLSEESYDKITDNANRLKGTLIGNKAPNVILQDEEGTPWELYADSSAWTVLVFWAPDCGHCTKAMPDILSFNDKWKDKGVNVVAVCTKTGKKYESCWKGVKDKKMEGLLNLGDQYLKSRYKQKFDVRQTPKVFILDQEKYIRMKDVPAKNLDEIMDEVIKMQQEEQEG